MTIRVNLLPPEARQPCWPLNRIFLATTLLVVFVLACIAGYNAYKLWKIEQDIAMARQQFDLLRPTQEKMVLANGQLQTINAKNAMLTKLTAERRQSWSALVTHMGMIVPSQIWLSEMGSGDKDSLKIKGYALTYPDLANFMQIIDKDEMLTEPVLVKAEQDATLAVTKFEMIVKIKGMQP